MVAAKKKKKKKSFRENKSAFLNLEAFAPL